MNRFKHFKLRGIKKKLYKERFHKTITFFLETVQKAFTEQYH